MLTIPALFKQSVLKHGDKHALSFVGEEGYSYSQLGSTVEEVSTMLQKKGIRKNDKVAILSTSMPNWGVSYFAIMNIGAVAVPLLPDFSTVEIENILEHSESKAIFVSQSQKNKLKDIDFNHIEQVIDIETFACNRFKESSASDEILAEVEVKEDDLAAIIYTSGTTGKSKGVMLTHKNLCINSQQGGGVHPILTHDRMLSILPLSHTYENTLGLLLPVFNGASVFYIKKPPTPAVLLPALKAVKPTAMLSVPLVIEKIYYNKVLPTFTKNKVLNILYKLMPVRKLLNKVAGKQLLETFGGELQFFGIGGAKLNKTVERFLKEAGFPYAIGYGLTETAPLLAGAAPGKTDVGSTGPIVNHLEMKIHQPNKRTQEGEIWVKGPNVMKGYYKEPGLTADVLTEDGWFKTGDLGVMDKRGYVFIKGRSKNVIIGASGENIYPEEIESVINNFRYVVESLVVEQKGKLVALVHFNTEELEAKYKLIRSEMENKVDELLIELKDYLDLNLNKFSKVQLVLAHPDPFQKTATQKIKRYLYV